MTGTVNTLHKQPVGAKRPQNVNALQRLFGQNCFKEREGEGERGRRSERGRGREKEREGE